MAGDRWSDFTLQTLKRFNSRPRVAGDPTPARCRGLGSCFNSRPRVAGDAVHAERAQSSSLFQFTPARGGRLGAAPLAFHSRCVSIHARAWRATQRGGEVMGEEGFNSRPRVAGDTPPTPSPPRGSCFNSRPRVAGDRIPRPRRRRRGGFNSRPRVAGDDIFTDTIRLLQSVSIHARAWRATMANRTNYGQGKVSIHARAWRATLGGGCRSYPRVVSIHARAWRATRAFSSLPPFSLFQFTPARGGRHGRRARVAQPGRFNSRPRVAGDPRATARSRRR